MDEIAQETDRAMSFHIMKVLLMYIKEFSDLYVAGLAE
jgi:predicted DNA-binding protein